MRRLSWERTRTLIYNSLLWSVSTHAFWCWTPQVQHCSMTHDGTKGLPKPRLPWEFPPNPATIHRCALELRGPFFAGLQDWIFSFMRNSSCQVKEESGLSQDKDDSAASIFYPRYRVYICEYSFHYVFLFRRVQMFSYNLFCPGKLSRSLEVSLSF